MILKFPTPLGEQMVSRNVTEATNRITKNNKCLCMCKWKQNMGQVKQKGK